MAEHRTPGAVQVLAKSGLLASTGGVLVGAHDAARTSWRGFSETLAWGQTIGLWLSDVVLVGGVSAAVGLLLGVALLSLGCLGFRWSVTGGLTFRERRLLPGTLPPALFVGSVGLCAAVLFKDHWVSWLGYDDFYLNRVLELPSSTLVGLVAFVVAVFVGLTFLCSRHWMVPWGWAVVWVGMSLGLGRLVYVEMYEASRIAPFSYLHSATLLGLLVFLAVGMLLTWRTWPTPSRRMLAAPVAMAVAPILLAAWLGHYGSHALRTVIHGRTVVAYRLLSWMLPFRVPDRALMFTSAECNGNATTKPPRPSRTDHPPVRGVVLIMIDTLRADRLRASRDGVALTPRLTGFASESIEFTRAYTTSPATEPALGAMLTAREAGTPGRPPGRLLDEHSAAQVLSEAGVTTVAVPNNAARFFRRGFERVYADVGDAYDQFASGVVADDIARTAIQALGEIAPDERFFMFIHFLDPHAPFDPAPGFEFGSSSEAIYDGEVAYTDRYAGDLIDEVRERFGGGVAIIVASDHGEEFADHGYHYHALRLYEESTRIVLLVDLPGTEPSKSNVVVTSTDIGATLRDLFGLPVSSAVDGRSLVQLAAMGEEAERDRFLWSNRGNPRRLAVVRGPEKLIIDPGTGIVELYDLESDPDERVNLADSRPAQLKSLYCSLRGWAEEAGWQSLR